MLCNFPRCIFEALKCQKARRNAVHLFATHFQALKCIKTKLECRANAKTKMEFFCRKLSLQQQGHHPAHPTCQAPSATISSTSHKVQSLRICVTWLGPSGSLADPGQCSNNCRASGFLRHWPGHPPVFNPTSSGLV